MIDNSLLLTENIEIYVQNLLTQINSIIIESYSMINLLNKYSDTISFIRRLKI